jgi:hypothetical protein
VCDSSPVLPLRPGTRPAPLTPHSLGGRGLLILDVLADRWGGCATREGPSGDEGGKTIWFELVVVGGPEPGTAALAA